MSLILGRILRGGSSVRAPRGRAGGVSGRARGGKQNHISICQCVSMLFIDPYAIKGSFRASRGASRGAMSMTRGRGGHFNNVCFCFCLSH